MVEGHGSWEAGQGANDREEGAEDQEEDPRPCPHDTATPGNVYHQTPEQTPSPQSRYYREAQWPQEGNSLC